MEVMFSVVAAKQLKKIGKGDRKSAKLIVEAIDRMRRIRKGSMMSKRLKANWASSRGWEPETIGLFLTIKGMSCIFMKWSTGRGHIMIKTQVIKEGNKPVAIVMDYEEYIKLKELLEDVEDYKKAVKIKKTNKKWIRFEELRKELDL
jgi:hypothetical protein